MFHIPNHDIYHSNLYQQQCTIFADHSKNQTLLAGTRNNQFEAIIPQNVVSLETGRSGIDVPPKNEVHTSTIDKQKKVLTNKSSVDTSNFSIEERLVAAVWVHERKHTKTSISQIKNDFRQRFGRDPPAKNTLLVWERKLFTTGSVCDAPRPGRPVNRRNHMKEVAASIRSAPSLSLRARAQALRLPRTTLRTLLRRDLAHATSTTDAGQRRSGL